MSEYQYYEFVALDRELGREEIAALRAFSGRAEISATRFVNEYDWGSFRGDEQEFLTRWFDVMVYVANWGTRRLCVSLPRGTIAKERLQLYVGTYEEGVSFRETADHTIVEFCYGNEGQGSYDERDMDGSRWMDALVGIRSELLEGDERSLYIAMLGSLLDGTTDSLPAVVAEVPWGMSALTDAQRELADFLHVSVIILAAAGKLGKADAVALANEEPLHAWLTRQPASEKDAVLAALLEGKDKAAGFAMVKRWREEQASRRVKVDEGGAGSAEVKKRAGEMKEEAEREALAAAGRRRQEWEAAREQALVEIGKRAEGVWADVARLVGERQSASYDAAVGRLEDLCAVAILEKTTEIFLARVARFRETHKTKLFFLRKLAEKDLEGRVARALAKRKENEK